MSDTSKTSLHRRRFLQGTTAVAAGSLAGTFPGIARADDWPTQPITFVIPSDVGGSMDRTMRGLAPVMSKYLGQPITVDNRPGGGTQLGQQYFLDQPQDGNTVLAPAMAPYISFTILFNNAPYKLSDFAFINAHWSDWDLIAASKESRYQTLPDLLAAIKERPGRIRASVVASSSGHVTSLLLLEKAGIPAENLNLVTFSGGGQARQAVAGGQVDFIVIAGDGTDSIREFLTPLAVVRPDRHPEWDADPVNDVLKPLNITVPLLSGSMRGLAMTPEFREQYPARWDKLVSAYKSAVEDPEFIEFAESNKMGHDWLGPEETTRRVNEVHDIFEQYQELMKS
ncbi:Bug family tripartite tricarboxylate transporter substrate binding protein [Acuticoccus kandeliae]|uniref:Bug family tripartite tricarboxylate transporter substrate binding protein n=1 Tax=Acuticoccus kandeliae TaxID=2073160 RepID=UPI000D3E1944|nr:tripartite tricarboxylate transporter substrate-binding protein [Acuticoccus kandeliae]